MPIIYLVINKKIQSQSDLSEVGFFAAAMNK
jgi:hypothetical protein